MSSSLQGMSLVKRDCLACPSTTPSCPTCDSGKVCSLVPQTCTACAYMTCVSDKAATTSSTSSGGGTNVGAIAGGVVGGVALIATITFLIWWFIIRPRKDLEEDWEEEEDEHPADLKSFREQRNTRTSVHTVHSIASSMISRASNMIPIAFIPGITNRDAPPIPPIPAALGMSKTNSSRTNGSDIIFSPGDLRDSTYSSVSTVARNRNTYLSISPSLQRESIASDIYHDDAVANPLPAQQIVMARPNMVSVKSSPTLPSSNASQASPIISRQASSESPRLQFLKPTTVTIGNKRGTRFPVRTPSDASNKPSVSSPLSIDTDLSDEDDEPHARARQSLLRTGDHALNSPFTDGDSDTASRPLTQYTNTTTLSAVIEEATWLAAQPTTLNGLGGAEDRARSPFGDEHKVNDEK